MSKDESPMSYLEMADERDRLRLDRDLWKVDCASLRKENERLQAALKAQAPAFYPDDETHHELVKERDELRAEVERLEQGYEGAKKAVGISEADNVRLRAELESAIKNRDAWHGEAKRIEAGTGRRRMRLVPVDRRNDKPGRPYEFEVAEGERLYVTVMKLEGNETKIEMICGHQNAMLVECRPGVEVECFELVPAQMLDTVK